MTENHFHEYSASLPNAELVRAVETTREQFNDEILSSYDYTSDCQVLLYGDVQSGKTSHMQGIISHCMDGGFQTVIVLTSPNTRLVDQTYERIFRSIPSAQVCKADMVNEFRLNLQRLKPRSTIIVMGKTPTVLDKWLRFFRETRVLRGQPVLIVDDEADATSLNTKVNKNEVSRINHLLNCIREEATGCIYLQVTGTPQAVLLQSELSGWKIDKAISFPAGEDYVGGDTFFGELPNPYTRVFGDSTTAEELNLKEAVYTHLVTSAIFSLGDCEPCNMLVHPSHLTPVHEIYEQQIKGILRDAYSDLATAKTHLHKAYDQLAETCRDAPSFDRVFSEIGSLEGRFKFLLVNSNSPSTEEDWSRGFNFIVGGTSLGRGLTFDFLQTTFYVRSSSQPQADTLWQHARMFGYKRDRKTIRLFIPASLSKIFQEVHQGNEVIKAQLGRGIPMEDLRISLGSAVQPTRANVLDKQRVTSLTGGVNYFAANPVIPDFDALDTKLLDLMTREGNDFHISVKAAISLTEYFETDTSDLDLATFRVALQQLFDSKPQLTARVVLRTGRKVNHGRGTLLSPNDQRLSKEETRHPLLILYRIEGVNEAARIKEETTWSRDPIWVPNIMLPIPRQYWRIDES
ncbi:Z1 domain-containing protein [Corynebacterium auriscanis]|uniref:Z1 domain-containing protein n=1 Tax=Corynebacterium auriscanis TaxID=99807 RepID=UPI003CF0791E